MLKRILGGEVWTKREVQEVEGSAGEKVSTGTYKYGNVERDTSKTTNVGEEIGSRIKAHKE